VNLLAPNSFVQSKMLSKKPEYNSKQQQAVPALPFPELQ
tara:strand:+ start:611 stop:727 length:117 start_codon:yes stop_codon:yes gene_type:complete